MRWPWQRRRTTAVPVARHALPRQAAWAAPAFPPAAPPAAPVAVPLAVPVQSSGVLLGFADGSHVALDERDPNAVALLAVASILSEHRRAP
jgi:hypothetical protein